MKRGGFTLIEALAVISIIGILATLTVFTISQAQRYGRDAKRRSDLTAIALAFEARFEAETCSNAADRGYYPGRGLFQGTDEGWLTAASLLGLDDCGPFEDYLTFIPQDPAYNVQFPYLFDLSKEPPTAPVFTGRHFRLAARLERPISSQERDELARMSRVWVETFGGSTFPLDPPKDYSYFIGN